MRRRQQVVFSSLLLLLSVAANATGVVHESYAERFAFSELGPDYVLTSFEFEFGLIPAAGVREVFPPVWERIASLHNDLRSLRATLTKGRWDTDLYGQPQGRIYPSGAHFFAHLDRSQSTASDLANLTTSLSNILCSNLKQLSDQHLLITSPHLDVLSDNLEPDDRKSVGSYWAGALAREAVCTENLTPLFALLPCRNVAGVASLITPRMLFKSPYHALQIEHQRGGHAGENGEMHLHLKISITAVLSTSSSSFSSLLGLRPSSLKVNKQGTIAELLRVKQLQPCLQTAPSVRLDGEALIADETDPIAHLTAALQRTIDPKSRAAPSASVQVTVSRQATGYGDERGGIYIHIADHRNAAGLPADIRYFETLPHFLRYYVSQLRVLEGADLLTNLSFSLPEDRRQTGWLHFSAVLPPQKQIVLHLPFEKVFRAWTEFPPDAHLGEMIPAGLLVANMNSTRELMFTKNTLVMLPTPDFSMPYNTIMLSGTMISLFFGSLFNKLIKHHRYLRDGSADPSERPIVRLLSFLRSKLR